MDQQNLRQIYSEIDRRSYDLMKAAEHFVECHALLTASQASGLIDAANCVDSLSTLVTAHIQHQATKSTTKDRDFWQDLKREIDGLRKPAEEISETLASVPAADKARREQLSQIQLLLARDYIQHLVAHEVYRKALQEGNHGSLA